MDAGELSDSHYNNSVQREISSIIRTSWGTLMAIETCKKMCWCWNSLQFALTMHIMQACLKQVVLPGIVFMLMYGWEFGGGQVSDFTLQKAPTVLPKWRIVMGLIRSSEHKEGYLWKSIAEVLVCKWLSQHPAWKTINWINVASSYRCPRLGQ